MKRNISWFINLYLNEQLDLNPPYQRRSVWTLKDRKFFLDTVFRNYPCPTVFLHKEIENASGKMIYRVVDGKQRLETLILFFKNQIAIDNNYEDYRLAGKRWESIENIPELKERFLDYAFTVEFIDTKNKFVINEIFDRLNRNSRKLERQELRHAKYDGWFITMAEKEAEDPLWEHIGVITKAKMKRMKDVQCISELLVVLLKNQIFGYDQDLMDEIYAEYDSPSETLANFDEFGFKKRLELIKNYILRMENHNNTVTKYATGFNNFYSLWSLVALNLNQLSTPENIAERYSEFMEKVKELSKLKEVNFLREYIKNDIYSKAYSYLKNSAQSSSEKKQRESRYEILKSLLLSLPSGEEKKTFSLSDGWGFIKKDDQGEHILKLIMGKSSNTDKN